MPDAQRSILQSLGPLFLVQFLSWSAMFCLWIYGVPVIAHDVFHAEAGSPQYGTALAAVGACYALYAVLGTTLAFRLPVTLARHGVRSIYAVALAVGAAGITGVALVEHAVWLIPAFIAIGISWCAMSNIPYAVVSHAAPEGSGAHWMRVFGFSSVAPQAVMTMLLALVGPHLTIATTRNVMLAGGALMACAATAAWLFGGGFTVSHDDW